MARLIAGQLDTQFFRPDQFGLRLTAERNLLKKIEKPATGVTRYETTWRQFKEALAGHRCQAYWLGIIEQALCGAKKGDAASDANLVLGRQWSPRSSGENTGWALSERRFRSSETTAIQASQFPCGVDPVRPQAKHFISFRIVVLEFSACVRNQLLDNNF